MNKKILFIVPTLSRGGQERAVSRLSFGLKNYFEEINLVTFYQDGIDYPFNGKIIALNLPLPSGRLFKIYRKIWSLFIRIYSVRKIKKELRPDFSISFGSEANIVNIFSNFALKSKTIISVHTVESVRFKSQPFLLRWYYNFVLRIIYKLALKIVAVSKAVAEDVIKKFGAKKEKVFVINNPYPIKEIEELSKEPLGRFENLFLNRKVIISAGRLTQVKGYEYLIEGFKRIEKKFSEAILVILGEGEEREKLENLVKKLQLKEKVFFLGFQKNPFKFFKKATIFVLPSLREGFPNVLVEAISCSLPVIATDCPGGNKEILAPNVEKEISEVFLGDYGILVPPQNLTELEKAISILLENEVLRKNYAIKAQKRAFDFGVEKIIEEWKKILK